MTLGNTSRLAEIIRSAAEYFSRDRVLRRCMPTKYGGSPIFVTPDSALSYRRFDLSRSNGGPAIRSSGHFSRHGDRVFDIGANTGLFAFVAAFVSGQLGDVIAVEPDPVLSHLLSRSVGMQTNPRSPIRVLTAAVSDTVGVAEFTVAARGRYSNHLADVQGRVTAGGCRTLITTVTLTVDWPAERFGNPTFVKIDVEGAEVALLKGAAFTLASAH